MRRPIVSLLIACVASGALGCAWLRCTPPENEALAREVEAALLLLRQDLDVPPSAVAAEIDRVLPPPSESQPAARRQLLSDHELVWLTVHQLIGFGESRERIETALSLVVFDEHGPYFPAGIEGHPAQVVAELSRLGVDPGERFAVGERSVTPAELVDAARDRFDPATVKDDPSWLIEAVTYGRDPTQGWVSRRGEPTWVHGYILPRLRTLANTNDLNATGLAEGGLHFAESIGRLVPRLAAHPDFERTGVTGEAVALYVRFLEHYQRTIMTPWLELAARDLEPSLAAYAAAPGEATAEPWLRRLRDAGHILEMAQDPKSWFRGRMSPVELSVGAQSLSRAVVRWYAPELAAARAGLEQISDAEGRPRALLCRGQLMHAHHALALWLASLRG
jgi:hypothetical protein